MKGLLLKDFYMAKKTCRIFLPLALIFIAISAMGTQNLMFMLYPILISTIIPVNLLSYDEKSKWNLYSGTLPLERSLLVDVKYLMILILLGLSAVLVGIAQLIRMQVTGLVDWESVFRLLGVLLMLGLLAPSLMLPVVFKYGAEKGRLAYYGILLFLSGLLGALGALSRSRAWQTYQEALRPWGIWLGVGVCAALFMGSWWLAIRFYERREL